MRRNSAVNLADSSDLIGLDGYVLPGGGRYTTAGKSAISMDEAADLLQILPVHRLRSRPDAMNMRAIACLPTRRARSPLPGYDSLQAQPPDVIAGRGRIRDIQIECKGIRLPIDSA